MQHDGKKLKMRIYKILVGKPKAKRSLVIYRGRCGKILKWIFRMKN